MQNITLKRLQLLFNVFETTVINRIKSTSTIKENHIDLFNDIIL